MTFCQRLTTPLSRFQTSSKRVCSPLSSVGITPHVRQSRRQYNFGSQAYKSCFGNLPVADTTVLRQEALVYLKGFNQKLWYDEPVTTILKGKKLTKGQSSATVDAFNRENGLIRHSTPEETQSLQSHITTYRSPYKDLRDPIRRIEATLLTSHAGFLIGNQMMDFFKFDGVTELEESTMANEVERRMNDVLLEDETNGTIEIARHVAFVGCVSNFTNFLDLFRKTLRNLECGVPVVILSRGNTTQHSYRWTALLSTLLEAENIDPGMLTYASCGLDDIKTLLRSAPQSPMYVTCSRDIAKAIKKNHPWGIASTGGPNTLVSTKVTPKVVEAVALSASIECAGQCTALRHAVLPSSNSNEVQSLLKQSFDSVGIVKGGKDGIMSALESATFAGLIDTGDATKDATLAPQQNGDYQKHPAKSIWYKISDDGSLPPDNLNENWRQVTVDVTTSLAVSPLAQWLVRNQPISLAINIERRDAKQWTNVAKKLFEETGLVVYTIGDCDDSPSLTCQARPQEGEVFGEFPVRRDLGLYTKYPVVVPSSTPAYDTAYNKDYLDSLGSGSAQTSLAQSVTMLAPLLDDTLTDTTIKGYCIQLANYLAEAATGPNRATGARTTLWGLQRPPLNGTTTLFRYPFKGDNTLWSVILPPILPFLLTNARSQLEISVPDEQTLSLLKKGLGEAVLHDVKLVVENDAEFRERSDRETGEDFYNVVTLDGGAMTEFPMVGNFVSLYFPLGHIKSTKQEDVEFWEFFEKSDKWLRVHHVW